MDLFMKYMNDHLDVYNITVKYSHFSEYIKAIHESKEKWDVYEGDFMPYASGSHSYWTGYYTTHPRLKGDERVGINNLRTAESIFITGLLNNKLVNKEDEFYSLMRMRKTQGDIQHHDAITGTEKQYVADDYLKILNIGTGLINKGSSEIITSLTGSDQHFSTNLTKLINELDDHNVISVLLYNNLAWEREQTVRLIVNRHDLQVFSDDEEILSQIDDLPSYSIDRLNGTYALYFNVKLPAMGYYTVYIKKGEGYIFYYYLVIWVNIFIQILLKINITKYI